MDATRGFYNVAEQRSPVDLTIKGTIPDWLHGTLWRNGPGLYSWDKVNGGKFEIHHWFDGLAMYHRFEITQASNGTRVIYSSHQAAEELRGAIADTGVWPNVSFGQDPCQGIFAKLFQTFIRSPGKQLHNLNVTLSPDFPGVAAGHLGKGNGNEKSKNIVAKTDANILAVINPNTLDVEEYTNYAAFSPELKGELAASHTCRLDGHLYNYTLKLGPKPVYTVFGINEATDQVSILARIADAPPAYIHSLNATQRFIILVIWQCDITMSGIPIVLNRNIMSSFAKWNPKRLAYFYVIDRHATNGNGLVARFTAPPFFVFHCINAFDDPRDPTAVVFDLSTYEDTSVMDSFKMVNLRRVGQAHGQGAQISTATLRRYRLEGLPAPTDIKSQSAPQKQPIKDRAAKLERHLPADTANIELPTVAACHHLPHRFVFGVHLTPAGKARGEFLDAIIKLDAEAADGAPLVWQAEGVPGEPVFARRPDGDGAEDDGVLMTVVLEPGRSRSSLVIIDARTMNEVGRAELDEGKVVPYGFHGAFRGHV